MVRSDENLITGNAGAGVHIEEGLKGADNSAGELDDRADALDARADTIQQALDVIGGGGGVIPPGLTQTISDLQASIRALQAAVGEPAASGQPATGLFLLLASRASTAQVNAANTATGALDARVDAVEALVEALPPIPAPPVPGEPPGEIDLGGLTDRVTTAEQRVGLTANAGLYGELARAELALAAKANAADVVTDIGDFLTMAQYNALIAGVQAQINLANTSVSSMENNALLAYNRRHSHGVATVLQDFETATDQIAGGLNVQRLTKLGFIGVAGPPTLT